MARGTVLISRQRSALFSLPQREADLLCHRGVDDHEIVYEPNGNVPPDFLAHGRVAVKVRRLE